LSLVFGVFELATARWITQHADALFLGPPGSSKSHLAQAIGFTVIQQGHRVLYREAHAVLDDLAEAQLAGTRKDHVTHVTTVPLLVIDDLGMRKLPQTAAEDLLELVMRRYERTSTLIYVMRNMPPLPLPWCVAAPPHTSEEGTWAKTRGHAQMSRE